MKKSKVSTLGINTEKRLTNRGISRFAAVLAAVILGLSLFAGCSGSSATITETMFQTEAAGSQTEINAALRREPEAGKIEQSAQETRPTQTSTAEPATIELAEASTTTGPKEETSPAKKSPKPIETTVKPVEMTAKTTETTLKPTEKVVKPVETTAKTTETTVLCNSPYIPMTSQEKSVADKLFILLNEYRTSKGIHSVSSSTGYLKAASIRAREASILFQHIRPDGSDFFSVLKDLGMPFVTCGENLAVRSGGISNGTAQLLFDQWMKSSGHNENMLRADWKYAGIGVCLAEDGSTVYAYQFFAAE